VHQLGPQVFDHRAHFVGDFLDFLPQSRRFPSHRMCSRLIGKDEMDAMMIGAPFGLGVLIALGVLLALMNHLSQ
jgi:hypothetical protein